MASSAMEQCYNCGKPVTEVKTNVDGTLTDWFHVLKSSNKKNPTNKIQKLCRPEYPPGKKNIATPPTISDAEARMHLDELDDLFREF